MVNIFELWSTALKCLVFSDSHGFSLYMKKAIDMHRDTEAVFFLGDGLSDIEEISFSYPSVAFFAVRGNCDFRTIALGGFVRKTASVELLSKKIVYTHGDLYGAKYGTAGLENLAKDRGADIVLFGHTHTPTLNYFSDAPHPFYLFNPGTVGARSGSFGIMTLTDGGEPLFSHGNIV